MLKTLGVLFIVLGASGAGFSMALAVKRQVSVLEQLISSLEQMKNEMEYRKTPLPELVRLLAVSSRGQVSVFWNRVSDDLHLRQEASVFSIFKKHLADTSATVFTPGIRHVLTNLAAGLGKFDVEGQLRAIDLCLFRLRDQLAQTDREQKTRAKSYGTLGICAGLALAILLF